MTTTSTAIDAVRTVLPPDRARAPETYAIDGVTPAAAFRPETRDEVARLLASCDAATLAVTPLGARTATALGRPLTAYDVAIDTTALARIIEYEPADLTITVEAGMTLATLQQTLGANSQFLPADLPPSDAATVGGLLATARPGAWRNHLPNQRDLILGLTVASPEGTLVHSGGKVVKNVSGYDLHRMHTGALGALGIIVEATFKLAPRPPAIRSWAIQCNTLTQAADLAFRLWNQSLPLRALSLLTSEASRVASLTPAPHVLLECGGYEAVLVRCEEIVRRETVLARAIGGEAIGNQPWDALRLAAGDLTKTVLRLGIPSSRVAETIEAAAAAGCTAWGHLAAGSVLAHGLHIEEPAIESLRALAQSHGGFLQIESAPAPLRRTIDPFGAAERDLVASLKHQFDPRGTLNRGRWQEHA